MVQSAGSVSAGLCYLGVFELQLCQLHQVLPESRHSSRLEVYELCVQNTVNQQLKHYTLTAN